MTVGRAYAVAGSLSRFYYSSRGRLYVVYSFLHGVFLQPARVSSTVLERTSARAPRRRATGDGRGKGGTLSSLVSRDTREVERVERARAHPESLSKAQLRGGQGSHTTQSHARAWLRVKASPAYGSDRPSCRASTTAGRSGPRHPRGSRARRACSPTGWRAPGLWLGKGRVRVLVRVRVRVRVGLVTWWRQPVPKKATASPKVAWLGLG